MTDEVPSDPALCVVSAQAQVYVAALWWVSLETKRAIIAPPVWKPNKCGHWDLAHSLVEPRSTNRKLLTALSPSERSILQRMDRTIHLVESGAPLVLVCRSIGSAYLGISPSFRVATNPAWADIYCSLRIAGQAIDDWEIAAELSYGFDVEEWRRIPVGELSANLVLALFSSADLQVAALSPSDGALLSRLHSSATPREPNIDNTQAQHSVSFTDYELPFLALERARKEHSELSWRLLHRPTPGVVFAAGFDTDGKPVATLRYGPSRAPDLSDILAERICGFAPFDIVAGRGRPPTDAGNFSKWMEVG